MTGQRDRRGPALPVRAEPDPPAVCRKLRTKMAFGSLQSGLSDWRHGDSTTAVYWCLITMETAGPDNRLAHPHGCQAGRPCFVPPAGSDLVASNRNGSDGDPPPSAAG